MNEATSSGRFIIDLPDSDAATALAGAGQKTLNRIEDLTGASVVMRGLKLELSGRPSQLERAAGVIGSPDMVLQKSSGNSSLLVKDKKNDTANNYSSDISTDGDGEYKFFF